VAVTSTVFNHYAGDAPLAESATLPIGKPIQNSQIYLLDEQQMPVPVGVSGEMYIGGDGLARGYRGQPELTAQKFVDSPFAAGERLYRTGDLARYLPDGNIEFIGRIDHQVKLRGFRIELNEINEALIDQSQVKESLVLLREDKPGDKHIVAYLVLDADEIEALSQIKAALKRRLPDYMLPSAYLLLNKLPLTPNGKVDRKALPKPDFEAMAEQDYVAPQSKSEKQLCQIWQQVLERGKVGIKDNFFDIGGHSLLATRVLSEINAVWSVDTPVRVLFEKQTIAELADYLDNLQEQTDSTPAVVARFEADENEAMEDFEL
jgi:hypothetical protein